MKLKFLFFNVIVALISNTIFAQEPQANIPSIENKISFLDSIKKTFIHHEEASCVDQRIISDFTSQELFDEMVNDIKNINLNTPVDYDLSTDLLKQRLKELDAKSAFNIEYNPGLENIIKFYLKNRKKSYERLMGLSQYYFPMFEEALARKNVPLEIKYLAIVESALNPRAVSKAGATGLWQFMYGTAKQYNLDITTYVDERSDALKASEAASQYMVNMYSIFGDWDLVLASYNAGPGNVTKAIRRSGGKQNYWNIRPFLPKETQGYVPAFLATMYIFEYHKEHGIKPQKPVVNHFATDTLMIKNPITFKQLSDLLDISVTELQFLNPSYKRDYIPSIDGKNHFLRLPVEKVAIFTSNEDKIYAYAAYDFNLREKPFAKSTNQATASVDSTQTKTVFKSKYHKVRRGETLSEIANKYDVSAIDIKKWNKLRSNKIPAGKTLKIKTQEEIVYQKTKKQNPIINDTVASNEKEEKTKTDAENYYIVEKGDNLKAIALKFNVSVEQLKEWNNLNTDQILLGSKLQLAQNSEQQETIEESPTFVEYKIEKGDNLSLIAKKFNTTIDKIKEWNKLEDNTVKVGNSLKIVKPEDQNQQVVLHKNNAKQKTTSKNQSTYMVRKGDSLFSIAQKFPGVSVADLKRLNGIRNGNIKPGMKLKISG